MKNILKFTILFLAIIVYSAIIPKQAKAQQYSVSFQTFYDELSPYGEWVDYPEYGYVWIPDAGSDFVPYSTQGQWVYTEYGWTWVSNYEWGWAPFHYGRWDYDNYYGWLWVPDNQWGPSWVTWIRSDGYYGWQPMQPGISISLSFGRDYRNNYDHWTFVRDRDFERRDIQRYYVDRSDHDRIMKNYTVINQTYNDRRRNTTYISGPARDDVQRVTGTKVRSVTIQENRTPGQNLNNNRLRIYRPEVNRNSETGHQAAPSRVVNLKDVKRSSERNSPNQSRNLNPDNSKKNKQQRNAVTPQNQTRQAQPAQQKNVNQPNDKRQEQQQEKTVAPRNQSKQVQPAKQRNVNQPDNKRQEQQQQKTVTPRNQSKQVQPAKQRNVNQTDNKKQEQQQKTVAPQKQKKQAQPAQRRTVKQTGNTKQVKPTRAEKQNTKRSKQSKESNSQKNKTR
ncbi:MAG: DUF6600 domain-containing protein [Prolixibacteraceae bacterium]|jgi:hypothetical protein